MKTSPRSHQPPFVSIVIPVFNKCDLTLQCLKAISEVTGHVPHEVIVVDNASTDATPQRMQGQPAHIRYIRNPVNRNFAGACNQGAALASGKYLLFLNNDTIPFPGWLDALVDEVRAHPEVAAVGSKLLYENGLVQHAGVIFARETRSPFHPYRLLRADDPRVNHRRELQAVTAACVLIRPKWFKECGGFNEEYRNGYEDLDLCLAIRKRGGVIVYQPKSVVRHLESQTPGRMKYDNENRALFFSRWTAGVLSDEDAYYFADGYHLAGQHGERAETPRLMRFADDAERDLWLRAAQAQTFAAQWRRDDLAQVLADKAWPQEPDVRRWAGCLCRRLQLNEEANRHFAASLALREDEEIRILLAGQGAAGDGNPHPESLSGSSGLLAGCVALRASDFAAAQAHFEAALSGGAAPGLALAGLWRAARHCGTAEQIEQIRRALLALPRLDPVTEAELSRSELPVPAPAPVLPVPAPAVAEASPAPSRGLTSIIVLVLNQLEHTRRCLESIAAHTREPHELIVVDNGSTDGTPEYLKQWQASHPACAVIRNAGNRGFAAGNNQGLSIARGEQVLFLNNDTVVTEGWLEKMLDVFERHPEAGIVGPVSNNVSGPQRVKEVGYEDLNGLQAFAAQWSKANAGQSIALNRAVGFCLLARRALISEIGGLDEQFGSGNFEDDDFCIRARLAGFRVRAAKDAFVHHAGSQTFKGAKIDYRQAMLRNWELFRTKWQLPAEASLERGYPIPARLPDGVNLKVGLPSLESSHRAEGERFWTETVAAPATQPSSPSAPAPAETPLVARIGNLDEARDRFGRRELAQAWDAAFAAIRQRPFHPEGYLLLAEIALAAGDSATARQCAQRARDLAPGWKAPKQFLQKPMKGGEKPEWLSGARSWSNLKSDSSRLTVCVIAKNEELFLAQCLRSVKDVAAQIVVVDTGSTDRTVEIAKEFGADVHYFEWCDSFGAARNAALEHAAGDWILMLDADEELPSDQHKALQADMRKAGAMAFRLPLVNRGQEAEGQSYVPRLFRNLPGACYRGRIHEQVFSSFLPSCKSWGMETLLGTARLLHHGYAKEIVQSRQKIERNLRLLRQGIQERPDDINLLMNLGLELVRSDDLPNGVTRYREAFRLMSEQRPSEVVPELREVLLTQFASHLYKLREHEEIVRLLTSPLARNGGLTASLCFALGLAHYELKQYREAAEQMRKCLSKRKEPALSPITTDILTSAPQHCLAMSLAQLGDAAAADKAFKAALEEKNRLDLVKRDYARFLAGQNRGVDALRQLTEVVTENAKDAAAWRLGGEIALSSKEFLEFAYDWTGEAIRSLSDDGVIVAQRAEALLLRGEFEQARPLWERACNGARPARALAAVILCAAGDSKETSAPRTRDAAEETAVSRAFLEWYRRLIHAGAAQAVCQLNSRRNVFRDALPTAAGLLDSALAEANKH